MMRGEEFFRPRRKSPGVYFNNGSESMSMQAMKGKLRRMCLRWSSQSRLPGKPSAVFIVASLPIQLVP